MGWVRAAMLTRRGRNGFPTGAAAMLNPPPALLPPDLRWVVWVWLLAPSFIRWVAQRVLASAVRRAARGASTAEALLLDVAWRTVRRWRIATIALLPTVAVLTVLETQQLLSGRTVRHRRPSHVSAVL